MRRLRPLTPGRTAALALTSAVVLGALCRPAAADEPTPQACIAWNESAGPLRKAGKLREARARLRQCSVAACPDLVRNDCVQGAMELDAAIPTVVFAAQDASGADLTEVSVTVDGEPIAQRLDGKPLEVDPGEHVFRLEAAGQPAVEKKLVVAEGEKNRRERVVIGSLAAPPQPAASTPPVAPPPASIAPESPTPSSSEESAREPRAGRTWGIVLGGVGVAGLVTGAVTGLMAASSWSQAKNDCGPTFPTSCLNPAQASGDRSRAVTTGTISTVAFIAGGVALAAGALLYLEFQ